VVQGFFAGVVAGAMAAAGALLPGGLIAVGACE